MKFFVALISLGLLVACVSCDWEAAKKKLKEAHEKCNQDPATALPQDVIEQIHKGEKPTPNEKNGPHILCVSKTLGWQHADGTINKDVVKQRITSHISDSAKQQQILGKCNHDMETEMATAVNLFNCIGQARHENIVH